VILETVSTLETKTPCFNCSITNQSFHACDEIELVAPFLCESKFHRVMGKVKLCQFRRYIATTLVNETPCDFESDSP